MYILTIELNREKTALESHIRNIDDVETLQEYYRYLDCRCIDMAPINVDGHVYDVVCDDEAMLRQPLIPSLYISEEQVFFGNLAFVKNDEEGSSVGLDREDMIRLLDFIDRQKERLYRWTAQQVKQKQEMYIMTNELGGNDNGKSNKEHKSNDDSEGHDHGAHDGLWCAEQAG